MGLSKIKWKGTGKVGLGLGLGMFLNVPCTPPKSSHELGDAEEGHEPAYEKG